MVSNAITKVQKNKRINRKESCKLEGMPSLE